MTIGPWQWVGLGASAAALVIGIVFLASARGGDRREPARVGPVRVSRACATVVGLALGVAAYHLAAWSLPAGWLELRVPIGRWWVLAGALAGAIVMCVLADAIWERRLGEGV